ncbi:MAG: EFR1 family ferrodoxin [Bacteroidaceae bacterium]
MIFYFSGTGNTRSVAETIAKEMDEDLYSIPAELDCKTTNHRVYTLRTGESIGFAFPVYAWGLPKIVQEFLRNITFEGIAHPFLYFVCTCGDDIGCTRQLFQKAVRPLQLTLHSAYSLVMPDCYISLPGFDVDSDKERDEKLQEAPKLLKLICKELKAQKRGIFRLKPGPCAWAKSYILRPLFNLFLMSDKPFRTTDPCINCGKCAQVCPLHNIDCSTGKPIWNGNCTGCLACYHHCPKRAIEYGKRTYGKGQYLHEWYVPKPIKNKKL